MGKYPRRFCFEENVLRASHKHFVISWIVLVVQSACWKLVSSGNGFPQESGILSTTGGPGQIGVQEFVFLFDSRVALAGQSF